MSVPQLTKYSKYRTQPKYTFSGQLKPIEGSIGSNPPANKYDVRGLMEKTSKFSRTQSVSFGTAGRWGKERSGQPTAAPGSYDVHRSTLSDMKVSFGTSTRPPINQSLGLARGPAGPGPGLYEVRGKNRRNDPTLSDRAYSQPGRHGWFYDNPEADRKPGPGQYSGVAAAHSAMETRDPAFGFGTSIRPPITEQLGVGKNAVGPGQYPKPSTLGGNVQMKRAPAYSFTSAGGRIPKAGDSGKEKHSPPMVPSATQFGY